MTAKKYGVSFGGDEKAVKLIMVLTAIAVETEKFLEVIYSEVIINPLHFNL